VRSGDFREVIAGQGSAPELFNLAKDVGEKNNISATHPEKVEVLEKLRKEWNSQLIAPVFDGEDHPEKKISKLLPNAGDE
jgi:hypothetical protein